MAQQAPLLEPFDYSAAFTAPPNQLLNGYNAGLQAGNATVQMQYQQQQQQQQQQIQLMQQQVQLQKLQLQLQQQRQMQLSPYNKF
jgi:hypothetical protein